MTRGWTRPALVAVALAIAAAAAWAVRWRLADPGLAFLEGAEGADWIVYPRPADARAHPLAPMSAVFVRTFALASPPGSAPLAVRAMRRCAVAVNGTPVPVCGDERRWKEVRRAEVAPLLRAGENRIEVQVVDDAGPPALWLRLEAGGVMLATDEAWQASLAGAAWRAAAPAWRPGPGRRYDPEPIGPSPLQALLARGPALLAYALAGAAGAWLLARRPAPDPLAARLPAVALASAAVVWCALLAGAAGVLPVEVGFDARQHLEYVSYLLERHALPLPEEGWQMFQPPLYYLLAAATLGGLGLDVASAGAGTALRGLGLAIGLAHLAVLAALLRRLFPTRPAAQVAGLAVASALPCALTLHLFPTNEVLDALLCSAALLVAVRILEEPGRQVRRHLLLGLLLGLALLAKVSALVVAAAALAVLGWRAVAGPATERAGRLGALAGAAGASLATAGWHYGRVWLHAGTPLVGGWEARPGLGWWADPGLRTPWHFLRFGRALRDPIFAGHASLWDGLYSTLWGDGMLSGLDATAPWPPWWAPVPHAAGYLLALLPSALVLVGLASALRRAWREPAGRDALLVAVAGLTLAAQVAMSVRVPAVAQDKASYGLLALGALAAFAARGFEAAAAAVAWRRVALTAGLAAWVLNTAATFWVDRDGPAAHRIRAIALKETGRPDAAEAELQAGLRRAPGDWPLRVALARLRMDRDAAPAEVAALLAPAAPGPGLGSRHAALALLADGLGDRVAALRHAGQATALDPDATSPRQLLASLLEEAGQLEQAADAWREVVRVDPWSAPAHAALARIEARLGRPGAAALHRSTSGVPAR